MIKRLTNHGPVSIPGTTVVAYFGIWSDQPDTWIYSLWGEDGTLTSVAEVDLTGLDVTGPKQVARIVYLLDVDYAGN